MYLCKKKKQEVLQHENQKNIKPIANIGRAYFSHINILPGHCISISHRWTKNPMDAIPISTAKVRL